jgi:hypothetical protein
MTIPKPKSPTRIEVWRHEVASSASFTPSESGYLAPPIRKPSFWKKILRRNSNSSNFGTGRRSKSYGDGKDSVKTEMYDPVEKEEEGLRVSEQAGETRRGGSSMEIGSAESELGGLRERRDRLERAAKLLNGSGKGKDADGTRNGEAHG